MNFATIRRHLSTIKFRFASNVPGFRAGSLFAAAFLVGVGGYAILDTNAHSNGQNISHLTQKYTNGGCSCHCSTASSGTTVSLTTTSGSSPLTADPNTTYTFTATVANSGESDGGIEIDSYSGNGLAAGVGLQLISGEITHSSSKSFSGGSTSWTFTYTTGSTNAWDTLYATGNAVNGDGMNGGGNCTDEWNWAPKFIIHTVVPTKRMALGRSSISLGQVRVGHRVADSVKVTSYGDQAITINSNGMKSGAPFSSFPTSSSRSINTGSFEIDSVIFAPTARGTFNDSLVFSTNSDTVPQQHMGASVSGQGIQAVFSATNGTTLSFGNLRVGRTTQQNFAFSNTGDDTLFLNAPSISGTGFSIISGGSSATLLPNQTGSVTVQFAAASKQPYSGTLSFSAANGVTIPSISLSGTGTLPQIQTASSQTVGATRVGLTLQGAVSLQNTGNDTLHISNATLTQPSARFSLGAFDQTVVPGATGTFHISYSPTLEKTDSATLHFISDDPTDSAVSIIITGSGLLPHMAVAQNGDTVDLGQVKVNSSATDDIAISNNGSFDLNISNVTVGPAPFSVKSSPTVVSGGTTSNAIVKFAPTAIGAFAGTLIVIGDDPSNQSDTVYLIGTGINSALSITPSNVSFGSVPVLTKVMDTITLQNTGSASLTITGYKLSPASGAFGIVDSSKHQVAAGASARVVVSFRPDTAGSYSGVLTLTTDDAAAPSRTINLSGIGVKGSLTIIPSSVDFGSVVVGHDSIISVMLRNSGQASVTISSVQFTGPGAAGFSDGSFSTPAVITAGDSTPLHLTFTPAIAQNYQGMALLTLGDGSSLTIGLQGVGTTAEGVSKDEFSLPNFSLSISPNPARNAITVSVTLLQSSETMLEVFDAVGKEVLQKPLGVLSDGSHDFILPLASLSNGSYFIRISNSNGDRVERRMVIER